MTEEQMNRLLMMAAAAIAVISGLACVGVVVMTAMEFSFASLMGALLLAGTTVGSGWATGYYAQGISQQSRVFNNAVEREVLSPRQRRDLRRARGEVVMEKALIEVEHERQNIVHKQIEAANDPEKPPHRTRFDGVPDEVPRKQLNDRKRERDRETYDPYNPDRY